MLKPSPLSTPALDPHPLELPMRSHVYARPLPGHRNAASAFARPGAARDDELDLKPYDIGLAYSSGERRARDRRSSATHPSLL